MWFGCIVQQNTIMWTPLDVRDQSQGTHSCARLNEGIIQQVFAADTLGEGSRVNLLRELVFYCFLCQVVQHSGAFEGVEGTV